MEIVRGFVGEFVTKEAAISPTGCTHFGKSARGRRPTSSLPKSARTIWASCLNGSKISTNRQRYQGRLRIRKYGCSVPLACSIDLPRRIVQRRSQSKDVHRTTLLTTSPSVRAALFQKRIPHWHSAALKALSPVLWYYCCHSRSFNHQSRVFTCTFSSRRGQGGPLEDCKAPGRF